MGMSEKSRCGLVLLALLLLGGLAWWGIPRLPALGQLPEPYAGGNRYAATPIMFERRSLGFEPVGFPLISNVQILDFDGDGRNNVVVCDVGRSVISLLTPDANGEWEEAILIEDVNAPAHATIVDLDGDGDLDILVSILGNIQPDDGVVGRVELHERVEDGYRRHVLLDHVRRVADVQAGDFNGNGRLDLAVAVFGYNRGEVLWLENLGDLQFRPHQLLNAPGTIHVQIADFDGDGDLDIAAIVSQDEEELWAFENLGNGEFRGRMLWSTINLDLGSAGLIQADLNQNGRMDLILPAGDNLEDFDAYPQPYHGCLWFENKGNWEFEMHRISDLGGTYAAAVGDINGNGHLDVVLVSMTNDWLNKDNASVVWLENDGQQNFRTWQIDTEPIHLVTVAVGDLTGDGRDDIVAGALNMRKPFERIGRVSAWFNRGGEAAK